MRDLADLANEWERMSVLPPGTASDALRRCAAELREATRLMCCQDGCCRDCCTTGYPEWSE